MPDPDNSNFELQVLLHNESTVVPNVDPLAEEEITEDVIIENSNKIHQIYSKAVNNEVT